MNHKEKLLELYSKACSYPLSEISLNNITRHNIGVIAQKAITQKGVYTVLLTLAIHKILCPNQDIRLHQDKMKKGFSGRTIDTKYITPTLKTLGLPSMAESGWLTRSLEQPFPYTLDYQGNIRDLDVKTAFLQLVDVIQNKPQCTEEIVIFLLHQVIAETNKNKITIRKISNPDNMQILDIVKMLTEHFYFDYHTFGGAKLPVLAFFAIYQSLINDIKRYDNCVLKELGYLTTCDTTSKSSGDIEVFTKEGELLESLEIKFEKEIDLNMVQVAFEKIIKFNPKRYYILSTKSQKREEIIEIDRLIAVIRKEHGCQLIINGVLPSLKYYLRLISDPKRFLEDYSNLIEKDTELKPSHKNKWNEIIERYSF